MDEKARGCGVLVAIVALVIAIGVAFCRWRIAQALLGIPQPPWGDRDTAALVAGAIAVAVGIGLWIWSRRD